MRSLFKCDEFYKMYFDYNNAPSHTCSNGNFGNFCCTDNYKNNELFQSNKNCVQIQISADDFEICNPLGSKANLHKGCGVYFSIRNMPFLHLSKLKNVHLLSLFNPDDIRTKQTDMNNIWQPILRDLKYLETVGINVRGENIKGTLTHLSMDNLGANQYLGFTKGFNAEYYCRICEMSKPQCQCTSQEDPSKFCTKSSNQKQIQIISEWEKVDLSQTKGVQFYCILSDLQFFHIIDNPTTDICHNIQEGAISLVLELFLTKCLQLKCFSIEKLLF